MYMLRSSIIAQFFSILNTLFHIWGTEVSHAF